jgi:hypothetical protein
MRSVIDSIKGGVPDVDFPNRADDFNYVETEVTNDLFTGRLSVDASLATARAGANTILHGTRPSLDRPPIGSCCRCAQSRINNRCSETLRR